MELDQVVYEYGKLQLNFVACQRQNALLGTQLAQMNKVNVALTTDKGKALARVAQLSDFITREKGFDLPDVPKDPEPADPAAGDPAPVADPSAPVTGVATQQRQAPPTPITHGKHPKQD